MCYITVIVRNVSFLSGDFVYLASSYLCCVNRRVDPDPTLPERIRSDADDEGHQQEILSSVLFESGSCR